MTVRKFGRRRLAIAGVLSLGILTGPAAAAQVFEPSPEPTETQSPSPEPTVAPTSTPSPTETPTSTPTPSPTTPSPSPSPSPTTPTSTPTPSPTTPSPSPSPEPTDPATPPPGEPIDHEAAVAFAEATAKLRVLTEELTSVEAQLVGADARLSLSSGHTMRAEAAADLAARRVDAIAAELQTATALLDSARLSVGGQVRRTYQDGGAGAWSTVLAAKDAGDFAERATDLQTVSDTRGHAADLVGELPARITALRDAREIATTDLKVARGEARAADASHLRLAEGITAARARIEPLKAEVAAAVAAATAAIPADQALSLERRRESDRLAAEMVEKAAALQAAGGVVEGTGSFARPATGIVTSDYGWRMHPILGYRKLHTGIDFDGADDVVYAADDGVVIMTVWSESYGNVTVIDHGMSGGKYFATFYAHQAGYLVDEGDVVRKGQPIGAVGSTGLSTGPHLHFEVRLDGAPIDPNPFLD